MRHLAPREFSHPQLSLENILNRRNRREEALCNYSDAANGYFCIDASSRNPKVKRGRPERGESLQGKSPLLNF
jgi:hypothetical protein